jgi:hypothetical protein
MSGASTGVAWRVAGVAATFQAGDHADAPGAGDVAAWTGDDSPSPLEDATVSSAIPTADESSAGVATASTTGVGSGVGAVVGVARAGEAMAETVGVCVGGGAGGVAVADVASAGEAVAAVAAGAGVVAAGAGGLAADAPGLAADAAGLAAGAGGLAGGSGGLAAGPGGLAAAAGGAGVLAAGPGVLVAGAAGAGFFAAGASGLGAGAGVFAAGVAGFAAGAGFFALGAGVSAAGAGLFAGSVALAGARAAAPVPLELVGVSFVPGVAVAIADGATIAAPTQAHVNVATPRARTRSLVGPNNREAPTGRHHGRLAVRIAAGIDGPISGLFLKQHSPQPRLTQGHRAYSTSVVLWGYFSVTTKRARVTPSPSSLAPATTAPKVSR